MTLQRQFKYLRSNGDYISRYNVLEKEALAFMHQLAKAHSYRHPTDGSNLPEARMGVKFYDGLNGNSNRYFIEKFGIDPDNVNLPFMLSQVPAPKNTGGDGVTPHGKLHVKKKNEINLLGQKAPPAEYNDQPQTPNPVKQAGYSGPKQEKGGCQCLQRPPKPMTSSSSLGFYLDCNGDPYDEIFVQCQYYGTERGAYLNQQIPIVNGKRHGTVYSWRMNDTTGRSYLSFEQNYFNGKMNGPWKIWKIERKSGRVYLETKYQYVNGKKHGISIDYRPNGAVRSRSKYIDGKFIETVNK